MNRGLTLRRQVLAWVSIPLGILWAISAYMDYDIARRYVTVDYDRALLESALDIGRQVHVINGQVRVDLPRPELAIPGMAAKVDLVIGNAQRLVIPADAVMRRGELTAVQVIGTDGKKSLRQVRLGERFAGGLVEVLAGVQAGEQVALTSAAAAAPAASH